MKLRAILLCVLMTLSLAACQAGGARAKLAEITALYMSAREFDSRVAATAQLPDRTYEFTLDWHYGDGVHTMTVILPEEIAGIGAVSDDNGLTFTYEGAAIVLNASGGGISPVEALPELYFGWSGGLVLDYASEKYGESRAFAVTYSHSRGGAECTQRVWFDQERGTPLRAEFYDGGALVLSCEFLTFSIAG